MVKLPLLLLLMLGLGNFTLGWGDDLPFVADELIIVYKSDADDLKQDEVENKHGDQKARKLKGINGRLVKIRKARSLEKALKDYKNEDKVLYAEPNYTIQRMALPNDPRFGEQWHLRNTGQTGGAVGADIKAELAWNITTGTSNVVVGVVDTGVSYNHPDLAPNMWTNPGGINGGPAGTHGYNAIWNTYDVNDELGHGSAVAGVIGAVGNNALGVSGINWQTSIMGLKIFDPTGNGTIATAVAAIDFAITAKQAGVNVRVLNNSWGGVSGSQALADIIRKAYTNDILFIAAAGNNGLNNDIQPFYPSSFDIANVLAVAASDPFDQRAGFSNYGARTVHLAAPGVNILSTVQSPGYALNGGTSLATPHVSGAAALILAQGYQSVDALKALLLDNADRIPSHAGLTVTGGRLNVYKALLANVSFSVAITPNSQTINAGSSASYTVTVTPAGGFSGTVNLNVSGLPTGASGSFSPATVTGSGSSTLTINTSATTPTGSFPFAVTAVSGSLTKTTTATLVIQSPPTGTDTRSFANTTAVTIPDRGNATPFPSAINVSGLSGTVGKVTVTLTNLSHSWPQDIGILLVGPAGQKVVLMSRAGGVGANRISNVIVTFDDAAATALPNSSTITTGTYKPASYGNPKVYPAPAPAGPYGTALSAFSGANPNGTWSLYVVDDASGDQGSIAGGWSLRITTSTTPPPPPPPSTPGSFVNATAISIPDRGSATPYPSTIAVSGLSGAINKVTVTVNNLSHTWPQDIGMLLVSPTGQKVVLMSRAGGVGANRISNVTVTFDDAAATALPNSSTITTGTYKPASYGTPKVYPTPAPAGPYATTLSAFNGANPNGTWSLYVVDDASGDRGSIASGWGLKITTGTAPPSTPPPAGAFANTSSLTIPDRGSATPYPSTITVAGLAGTLAKATVTVSNMSHTWPKDVGILLVSPTGQKVVIMSGAIGEGAHRISNVTLTFDDAAANSLPSASTISSGTFKPTTYGSTKIYPTPAPSGPYGATLAAFNGINPNGTWSLYVVDDATGDRGSIAGGWSLRLTTATSSGSVAGLNGLLEPLTTLVNPVVGSISDTMRVVKITGVDADTLVSPLTPMAIASVAVYADGRVGLSFNSQPKQQYRIEASSQLGDWLSVGQLTATQEHTHFVDNDAPNHRMRYYRVVQ